MTESNSTKSMARPLFDIATDIEGTQDTLRILSDMALDEVCNWSMRSDQEAVGRMVERLIVLGNTMSGKIAGLDELANEVYALAFKSSGVVPVA